jgi:hypothetical protein
MDWYSCAYIEGQLKYCEKTHEEISNCEMEYDDWKQDKFSVTADGQWFANWIVCEGCALGNGGTTNFADTYATTGNFQILNKDQLLYPRFADLVKGLKAFANSKPDIMAGLKIWTGLTDAQIQSQLQFGKGPTILIQHLDGAYGMFRRNDPNVIIVNKDFVLGLEQANLQTTKDATGFLLSITLLHEYVHYGDFASGQEFPGEEGLQWENSAFGVVVNKTNASDVYIKMFGKP